MLHLAYKYGGKVWCFFLSFLLPRGTSSLTRFPLLFQRRKFRTTWHIFQLFNFYSRKLWALLMASGWVLCLHSSSLYPQLNHPGPSVKAPVPELSSRERIRLVPRAGYPEASSSAVVYSTVVKFPRILLATDCSSQGSRSSISCILPSSRVSNYWGRVQEEPLQVCHDY